MSKLKKAVLIVFTLLFVMNLQINTSLTEGMNSNFSLAQLVENVFFPSVYATGGGRVWNACYGATNQWCMIIWNQNGTQGYAVCVSGTPGMTCIL